MSLEELFNNSHKAQSGRSSAQRDGGSSDRDGV